MIVHLLPLVLEVKFCVVLMEAVKPLEMNVLPNTFAMLPKVMAIVARMVCASIRVISVCKELLAWPGL
jgi:hypothetical protein